MRDDDETEPTEITRFKMNIQRGEGVDRRGDITVETVRERDRGANGTEREVTLPSGETVTVETHDDAFAEFYFEAERAKRVLIQTLGLTDADQEDD